MPYPGVYSTVFIEYTDATPNTQFEVPSGYVAVVRQFSIWATLAEVNVTLVNQNPATGNYVVLAGVITAGFPAGEQQSGRWVVPPGNIIALLGGAVGTGLNAYIGGYLLASGAV